MRRKNGQVRKVLVIPDVQIPFEDKLSLKAVERYMSDERWDEVIYLGDFLDFHQLAKFTQDVPEALCKTLQDDYSVANAILDRHQQIVRKRNPRAKWTYLVGNHEDRVRRFSDKHPQLKGIIDVDVNLKLKERGFKVVWSYPKGEVHKIGKALFHHGLYTGGNHAKKMVDAFGMSIFYGHVHDIQLHSKVIFGSDTSVVGQSLGCLCRPDLDYVGLNPTNWEQAVTTFYFRPNGIPNYYISTIKNHSFVAPNGKVYDAN